MRRETDSSGPLNRGHDYRQQLGPECDGTRLLDHLVLRFPNADRETWRQRIDAGRVLLDDRRATHDSPLRGGQILTWRRPPWREPVVPLGFALLHRDPDLLVVAKPRGLPTLPGGGLFLDNTLLARLRLFDPRAAPAHRLGRSTSGLVLCGRNANSRTALARMFRDDRVQRTYLARISGHPRRDAFVMDQPIGSVPYAPLGSLAAASATGRAARSEVQVIQRNDARREGRTSLARIRIRSGRPHQIRIHLALAGHPLVGDPLYGPGGGPIAGSRALPSDPGYLLHAGQVLLPHPVTGVELDLRCPAPPDLRPIRPVSSGREARVPADG